MKRRRAGSAAAGGVPRDAPRLRRALLKWFRVERRDLPWRRTRDPYRVWLSEIMLQQTRVQTARPYYERFLETFSDVRALAAAPLSHVLKLWEGLGYYTRARNLHRAANVIVAERKGEFPRTAAQWQALPGIGRYTASAIASIALGEPVPVVDGNVKRVLARVFRVEAPIESAATQARIWELAAGLLAKRSPGDFNQALMELGARICTPRGPRCAACPIRRWCAARGAGVPDQLPVRGGRRAVPEVTAVAAAVERGGRYLLVRRPERGLLAGLWTLPTVALGGDEGLGEALRDVMDPPYRGAADRPRRHATDGPQRAGTKTARRDADDRPRRNRADVARRGVLRACLERDFGLAASPGRALGTVKHVFTHRRLVVHAYQCRVKGDSARGGARSAREANGCKPREQHAVRDGGEARKQQRNGCEVRWVRKRELEDYPCAAVDRKLFALLG